MTVAALHLAKNANAVSQAHGETARNMWKGITNAPQIITITNGVHEKTWQDKAIISAYQEEQDLWSPHLEAKNKLFAYIKRQTNYDFDPNILTIGFARRAAAYKRGGLIFGRMDILMPLLEQGKIQLVYSGKAHPHDVYGKGIIQEIVKISKTFPQRIVFLENYDMDIASLMVRGCDAWLNHPIRPMEASGTSGMKAALNGVLNISVIDGWVGEGVLHRESGWLLDKVNQVGLNPTNQDLFDLEAFYEVLKKEVIPIYYEDHQRWIKMMRASIDMAQRKFTAERMVKDYYDKMYRNSLFD
jgi:starch phosphorylase